MPQNPSQQPTRARLAGDIGTHVGLSPLTYLGDAKKYRHSRHRVVWARLLPAIESSSSSKNKNHRYVCIAGYSSVRVLSRSGYNSCNNSTYLVQHYRIVDRGRFTHPSDWSNFNRNRNRQIGAMRFTDDVVAALTAAHSTPQEAQEM